MTIQCHPEAEVELLGAIDFYESRQMGLGEDFALEVVATLERIRANPELWPFLKTPVRR